jgi:hypothetical protein
MVLSGETLSFSSGDRCRVACADQTCLGEVSLSEHYYTINVYNLSSISVKKFLKWSHEVLFRWSPQTFPSIGPEIRESRFRLDLSLCTPRDRFCKVAGSRFTEGPTSKRQIQCRPAVNAQRSSAIRSLGRQCDKSQGAWGTGPPGRFPSILRFANPGFVGFIALLPRDPWCCQLSVRGSQQSDLAAPNPMSRCGDRSANIRIRSLGRQSDKSQGAWGTGPPEMFPLEFGLAKRKTSASEKSTTTFDSPVHSRRASPGVRECSGLRPRGRSAIGFRIHPRIRSYLTPHLPHEDDPC